MLKKLVRSLDAAPTNQAQTGTEAHRSFALLGLAASVALLFTAGAGSLIYVNTQRLIHASEWVSHSQEVLGTLQGIAQRADRLDTSAQLYLASHNEADFRSTEITAVMLQGSIEHLKTLVSDNPRQMRDADTLAASAAVFIQSLQRLHSEKSALPVERMLLCRATSASMIERERALLTLRTENSRHTSIVSLITSLGFAVFALGITLALFVILLRDVLRHRRVGQEVLEANRRLADTIQTLEDRVRESRLLTAARDEFQLCVSAQDAYRTAVRFAGQILPGSSGALCMINNSRQMVERVANWGAHKGDDWNFPDSFPLDACCGLRSGHFRWRIPGISEVHCSHFSGLPPEEYLCIPMAALGDTLGVLSIRTASDQLSPNLDRLRELVELATMAIAGLNLRHKLENQSIRDSLTGLFNRHFMEIALERELRRAARQQSALAVFMLDVDHFKKFNDVFGHEAGDAVLREIGTLFHASIRSEDIACRYGGEEFVIILPEIPLIAAFERAERIRQAVSEICIRVEGETLREITLSIGVAMYPENGDSIEQLLRVADRNLYKAKQLGRNQVVLADGLPVA